MKNNIATNIFITFMIMTSFIGWDVARTPVTEVEAHEPVNPTTILKQPEIISVVSTTTPTPTPTVKATTVPQKSQLNDVEEYIYKVFGKDADRGIKMLKKCENGSLNPKAVNWNRNGTVDVGLWQHNINPNNKSEWKKLEDPYYSTDLAYKKFVGKGYHNHPRSFYLWTCGYIAGDYTYVDYLKSLKNRKHL